MKTYPKMKDSDIEWIGKIPEHWEIKKIQEIIKHKGLIRGPFGSSLKIDSFVTKGFKVYEQKNAIYDDLDIGNSYINKQKFLELKRFAINENDILMSCSGTIGKTVNVPKEYQQGIINQALLIFRFSLNSIKIEIIKYLINSI